MSKNLFDDELLEGWDPSNHQLSVPILRSTKDPPKKRKQSKAPKKAEIGEGPSCSIKRESIQEKER